MTDKARDHKARALALRLGLRIEKGKSHTPLAPGYGKYLIRMADGRGMIVTPVPE